MWAEDPPGPHSCMFILWWVAGEVDEMGCCIHYGWMCTLDGWLGGRVLGTGRVEADNGLSKEQNDLLSL
jgi:hypothetical protein